MACKKYNQEWSNNMADQYFSFLCQRVTLIADGHSQVCGVAKMSQRPWFIMCTQTITEKTICYAAKYLCGKHVIIMIHKNKKRWQLINDHKLIIVMYKHNTLILLRI